jgi:ornithine carbamoyltransferase
VRHFVDIAALEGAALRGILDDAVTRKRLRHGLPKAAVDPDGPLAGRILAMIFEKPSTRTRVSFDVAMRQLGGQTIEMNGVEMQLGRGETVADTARVLSRYVDGIMIRTTSHKVIEELAANASVPVINGLTNLSHPSQVMADIMTFEETKGAIAGRKVAWVGDGNNVAASWVHAAARFGFRLDLACPAELSLRPDVVEWARAEGADVGVTTDVAAAARGADCIVTDVWVSMSDETDGAEQKSAMRHNVLRPYQVNAEVMSMAAPGAVFMHCLPAHRGEEVTADVIDGPQSVVWDEAENRLHAQKGILTWCLG